jgi:teichuronic acid biosynthesis glycosyltransferase TuaG
MTTEQPVEFVPGLVSVIIPTYNRYELLNHSIKSVLANTYKHVEIIVINDCSTDQRYYSGRLEEYEKTTVIHLPVNMRIKHNVSSAQGITRNYGLEKAKGEWIAFLDDDDFYVNSKIEKQLEAMKTSGIHFCSTNLFMINHKRIHMDQLDFEITSLHNETEKENKVFNLEMIRKSNLIANSSVIIHHTIVKKTGIQHIVPREEDWDYWKRALQYTDCLYLCAPLVYYTWTVENRMNVRYYH